MIKMRLTDLGKEKVIKAVCPHKKAVSFNTEKFRITYCPVCDRYNATSIAASGDPISTGFMDFITACMEFPISTGDLEKYTKEAMIKAAAGVADIEKVSDGYHTFDSLYKQRLHLMATIVNLVPQICTKTWKHWDGEPCFGGGWFLVTVHTPEGNYGYHFEQEYWDMFHCPETETGPVFKDDPYDETDVGRLLSLEQAYYAKEFDILPVEAKVFEPQEGVTCDPSNPVELVVGDIKVSLEPVYNVEQSKIEAEYLDSIEDRDWYTQEETLCLIVQTVNAVINYIKGDSNKEETEDVNAEKCGEENN